MLLDMGIAIDTLAFARRLREAGFSEQQAEGQARALAETMTDTLATKQDLREMEERVNSRFADLQTRFAEIDGRFKEIDGRFKEIDGRFNVIDRRFDEIDRRFSHVDSRFEFLERHIDVKLDESEKRTELRLTTMATRADLIDLERRMTVRLGGITVAGIGVVSALVRVL